MSSLCPHCGKGYPIVQTRSMSLDELSAQVLAAHKPDQLAQHKQVIAELIEAAELVTQYLWDDEWACVDKLKQLVEKYKHFAKESQNHA